MSLWPWSPSAAARAGLVVNARSSGKSCGGTALKRRRWRVAELGFMTTRGVCSTCLATELAPRRSVRAGHTTPRPRAEEAPSVLPEQPEASCRRARPPATSPVIAESCGETGRPAALAVSPDGSIQPLDVESIIASWTSIAYRSACIDLAIELAATAKPRRPSKAAKRRRVFSWSSLLLLHSPYLLLQTPGCRRWPFGGCGTGLQPRGEESTSRELLP